MTPVSLPAQLGRYRLLRSLGQGGMGAVWVAFDSRLQREVALKIPLVNATANAAVIERFQREARLAASIEHPNFCSVHDVGEDQGYHFYVMPIIPGKPLTAHWQMGEPWPLETAAALIMALASALAELHARGIIHRDLKPANVMVKPDGSVVLMDFGLARSVRSNDALTGTGQALGTPSYMAPAQVANDDKNVGPAADVWALGVMLYQLIGGCLPFTGTGFEVLGRILHMQPPLPSEHRPDADTRLDAICMQALSKDAHNRPQSMAALAVSLGIFLKGKGSPGNELSRTEAVRGGNTQENALPDDRTQWNLDPEPPKPRRRREKRSLWAFGGVGMGLLAFVLGSIVLFRGWGSSPTLQATPSPTTVASNADKVVPKDKPLPPSNERWVEGKSFQNTVGMDLVWIDKGTFLMGSPDSDSDALSSEKPQRRATISTGFWMASKEVTRGQYKQFMKETGLTETLEQRTFDGESDLHPMRAVGWDDATKFCAWLSKKEKSLYDLPTEAQWEYCCRAGTTTRYSFGDDAGKLGEYAWYGWNAERKTHPVGEKKPNRWGLYDMHGNVWEWCKDSKPDGRQVLRGGSFYPEARGCRSAFRDGNDVGFRWGYGDVGFRVVGHPLPKTP